MRFALVLLLTLSAILSGCHEPSAEGDSLPQNREPLPTVEAPFGLEAYNTTREVPRTEPLSDRQVARAATRVPPIPHVGEGEGERIAIYPETLSIPVDGQAAISVRPSRDDRLPVAVRCTPLQVWLDLPGDWAKWTGEVWEPCNGETFSDLDVWIRPNDLGLEIGDEALLWAFVPTNETPWNLTSVVRLEVISSAALPRLAVTVDAAEDTESALWIRASINNTAAIPFAYTTGDSCHEFTVEIFDASGRRVGADSLSMPGGCLASVWRHRIEPGQGFVLYSRWNDAFRGHTVPPGDYVVKVTATGRPTWDVTSAISLTIQ